MRFAVLRVAIAFAGSILLPLQLLVANPAGSDEDLVTARIIGASEQVRQLREISTAGASGSREQILVLHQLISEEVLTASLEVDATVAQIDNEIARAREIQGYLSDRRDRSVTRYNLLSAIVGGSLSAASAGLQIPSGQTKSSAVVGIAGGALASTLAVAGIRAQKGGTRDYDFDSNMLARFFDRSALADSRYLPVVWAFLSEIAPTDPDRITRKERLIRTWITLKRLDSFDASAERQKIDRVTSQPSQKIRMTIDDLDDRAAMLEDVRAKLSFLKRDLASLLSALPSLNESISTGAQRER